MISPKTKDDCAEKQRRDSNLVDECIDSMHSHFSDTLWVKVEPSMGVLTQHISRTSLHSIVDSNLITG